MKPKPPICMSRMTTICPKVVQCRKVSTVMRPVTQVADVATSRESMKAVQPPFFAEMGRQRKNVPTKIMPRYPSTRICMVEGFQLNLRR